MAAKASKSHQHMAGDHHYAAHHCGNLEALVKVHHAIGVLLEESGNISLVDLSSVEDKLGAMTIDEINKYSKSKGRTWTLVDLIVGDVELNG